MYLVHHDTRYTYQYIGIMLSGESGDSDASAYRPTCRAWRGGGRFRHRIKYLISGTVVSLRSASKPELHIALRVATRHASANRSPAPCYLTEELVNASRRYRSAAYRMWYN